MANSALAASATGVISGTIKDPALGEYVKGAQVSIKGTNTMTLSGTGGYYELRDVPIGNQTIEVYFSGFRTESATVAVTGGETKTRDFTLSPSGASDGEVFTLEVFTVSTERAGNAKALMDQRNSMNVTNSVDSQTFGDNSEGNIGEFMRNMPGVQAAAGTTYGEIRQLRIRGFTADYIKVTMDGMSVASSDASNPTRGFSLETATLNSMDSIEVSKTLSADMDADAPAGTINLKSKRAFDRTGRQINVQANVAMHSEEMTLHRRPGPYDHGAFSKVRPGGIFEYSDIFFDRRLGIVLNLSESNIYSEALDTQVTWNRTMTATDRRPQVVSTVQTEHAPRFNHRSAATLTADFKATPDLSLGLTYVYNYADLYSPQRRATFNTGGRTGVSTTASADPLTDFVTSGTSSKVSANPIQISKQSDTTVLIPRLNYRKGAFELEGKAVFSEATSEYHPFTHQGVIRDFGSTAPTVNSGAQFRAQRSALNSADWHFTQVSGADIADGASYSYSSTASTNWPVVTIDDGRSSLTRQLQGILDASYKANYLIPVIWKTGIKYTGDHRQYDDTTPMKKYTYVGPNYAGTTTGGFSGALAGFRSPYLYDIGTGDGGITSLAGDGIFMPDSQKFAELFKEHPAYFREGDITSATQRVTDYFEGTINRKKNYHEKVYASYVMGTAALPKGIKVRGGIRFEQTETDSEEPNPYSQSEVLALYPTATFTGGRVANDINALNYQYLSRSFVHRTGKYHNYFPSGSVKFNLLRNLELLSGYAGTIRRPSYTHVAGIVAYDDNTHTITAPNVGLRPETSKNFSSRLAYYFEPSGTLSVSVFQNTVKNSIAQNTVPITDPGVAFWHDLYPTATDVKTYVNTDQRVKVRGLEIEYIQALTFLPRILRGFTVRGSYTRTYSEIPTTGLAPHIVSGSVSYTHGKFSANINSNWTGDYLQTASTTAPTYRRHRSEVGAGASWRLNKVFSLSATARNIFNTHQIEMQQLIDKSAPAVLSRDDVWGTAFTFSVKAAL